MANGFDGEDLLGKYIGVDLHTCKVLCAENDACAGLYHLVNRQDATVCRLLTRVSEFVDVSGGNMVEDFLMGEYDRMR